MARRSMPCTQADITRMIKGAIAAGVGKEQIAGLRKDRDGVTLLFGEQRKALPVDAPVLEETPATDASWSDVDAP